VLAYLFNPGRTKKVPEKMQKSDKIPVEVRTGELVQPTYDPPNSAQPR
jgi:hypothetical protein